MPPEFTSIHWWVAMFVAVLVILFVARQVMARVPASAPVLGAAIG